jgi:hypothetical protein
VATNDTSRLAGPSRPLGAPEVPQFYLPSPGHQGIYTPHLYGAASIHFADRKRKIDETRRVAFTVPLLPAARTVDWDAAVPTPVAPADLVAAEPAPGQYLPLPAGAMDVAAVTRWAKKFDRWLARTQRLDIPQKPDASEPASVGPKRGGVSVELVAIVWELTQAAQPPAA